MQPRPGQDWPMPFVIPHVICRDTEKEAWAQHKAILDNQDPVAADNFYATFAGGDQSSWKHATRDQWVNGGVTCILLARRNKLWIGSSPSRRQAVMACK